MSSCGGTNPGILSTAVIDAIAESEQAAISIVTPWELELKQAIGKLNLPKRLWDHLEEDDFTVIGIEFADALAAARLPMHHRDPFDRMIIAQALARGLTIVTRDAAFAPWATPIGRAWAMSVLRVRKGNILEIDGQLYGAGRHHRCGGKPAVHPHVARRLAARLRRP
jgi:PIN domain nuclease of toxin-antitoxin system